MTINRAMEPMFGQMDGFTKVCGLMGSNMAKAFTNIIMELKGEAYGKEAKE